MPHLLITVDVPDGASVPVLVADLESWLSRHSADLAGWQLEPLVAENEELGPAIKGA